MFLQQLYAEEVIFPTYLNGVLAHSQGIPQFNGLVPRTRHNLAVISRESHTQHILGVPHKTTGCCTPGKTRQSIYPQWLTLVNNIRNVVNIIRQFVKYWLCVTL